MVSLLAASLLLLPGCGNDRPTVNAAGQTHEQVEQHARTAREEYLVAVSRTASELAKGPDDAASIAVAATTEQSALYQRAVEASFAYVSWGVKSQRLKHEAHDNVADDLLQRARNVATTAVVRQRANATP